ncbi:hypothetical protein ACFWXA_24900 [Streptomyces atroolivaceus]|uniref:restriction endonuclease subunit S n=1 Tax=Streptomyces atroolivaceus TaxID=66869 RepID=UPI00366884CC
MTPAFQTVGEVAAVDAGPAFKSAHFGGPDEGIRLLRGDNIEPGALRWARTKTWPESMFPGYEHLAIQEGDLILGMDRPLISSGLKLARARPSDLPALLVQRVARIRPHSINGAYLYYWLGSSEFQQHLKGSATGTQLPHVNLKSIKEFKVPRFGEAAEARIVEVLEDHLSRLEAGVDYLDAGAKRLERLRGSLIDGLVWDAGYPVRKVRDLLREKMRNGHSAPAVTDGSDGIRTLTLTAVTLGMFKDKYTKITTAAPEKVRDMWLQPGDVFVQRSNTPELVGTTRMYEGPNDWAIFPDLLIRLRASDEVLPSYLALALNSERAQRSLRARAKGLAGSMPKIDQGAIGDTEIPAPSSADEQRQVVGIADARQAELDRVGEALDGAKLRASSLRRSLLAAAFSGRLTGAASDFERTEEIAADIVETEAPGGVLV